MAVGLITCGEVEDVAGALAPVGRGEAQVFHDLLVELRLQLVAEVEERREEEGQEESLEVESGVGRVEETTHMDDHDDGVKCGQGSNLSQCECDEMCKAGETLRAFSGRTCGCACCEAPRNR